MLIQLFILFFRSYRL